MRVKNKNADTCIIQIPTDKHENKIINLNFTFCLIDKFYSPTRFNYKNTIKVTTFSLIKNVLTNCQKV